MHNYACRFGAPSNSPKGGREGWRRFKAGVARDKGIVQTPKLLNSQTSHLSLFTFHLD